MNSEFRLRRGEALSGEQPLERAEDLRVVVISDAIQSRNGVGTYYQDLAEHLQPRIGEITIVAPRSRHATGWRDAFVRAWQQDADAYRSLVSPPFCARDAEWFSLPMPGDTTQRLAFPRPGEITSILLRQRPHVVVLPTIGPYTVFATRAAQRLGINLCAACHTDFEKLVTLYWPRALSSAARFALKRISRWVARQAHLVTTMSVESLEAAREFGAARTRMVGTPLATCFLESPTSAVRNPPRRVAYIGRLSPEKQVGQLITAAAELPDFQFHIVGDGPLRADIRRAGTSLPNLTAYGWLARHQVLQLVDHCDVLVLPSQVETFGTVALEALARERYVLVSPSCGIFDWPGLAQGLFTIDRRESLSQALWRLHRTPVFERDRIAARGWQAVRQFHQDTVDGWLSVLLEVAGQPTSRVTLAESTA